MSDKNKKQLLEEGTVRRWMQYADIGPSTSEKFLSENYGETEEAQGPCDKGQTYNKETGKCDEGGMPYQGLDEAGGMEAEIGDEPADMAPEGGEELAMDDEVPEMADELPEPDVDGEAAEAAEVTITPEELEVLTKVLGDLVAAQGGEGDMGDELDMGDEDELPPAEDELGGEELGGEELPEEEPMMESLVNKIAQRVAKRLMKERKKK